jgi:hypothetical protein
MAARLHGMARGAQSKALSDEGPIRVRGRGYRLYGVAFLGFLKLASLSFIHIPLQHRQALPHSLSLHRPAYLYP